MKSYFVAFCIKRVADLQSPGPPKISGPKPVDIPINATGWQSIRMPLKVNEN